MLLLTSFLDGVKDTFEKKNNANDLELQAMPIIHYHYYVMGKTKPRVSGEGKRELYYI